MQLREIDKIEEPLKKLRLMAEVNDAIFECINDFWRGIDIDVEQLVVAADQMVLIYLFIVIRAKVVDLFANIKYISEFTTKYVRNSNLGFYLATYENALYTLLQNSRQDMKVLKDKGKYHIIDMSIKTPSIERETFIDSKIDLTRGTIIPDAFLDNEDPFLEMSNSSFV